MKVYINSLNFNKSLVDGPGIRTLVFFQGCDIRCHGCQNQRAWDITKGREYSVENLAKEIKKGTFNRKITITGGEPLMQKEALIELLKALQGYDVIVYTGHQKEDVPIEIWNLVTYVKCGPFIEKLKTTIKPYVGSSNQELIKSEKSNYETKY